MNILLFLLIVNFIFIEKPQILGDQTEEIHLPAGREMQVECEAGGIPLPSLTWQRDSRQIDTTRAIITSKKPQINGTQASTLRIISVDQTVAGTYTCVAYNDVGTAQKYFKLSIIG